MAAETADRSTVAFEKALWFALHRGWDSLGQYGPVRSNILFDIVHQMLRVISTGPRAPALRRALSSLPDEQPKPPTFPGGAREHERLGPRDRHALHGMASRIMEDWPN